MKTHFPIILLALFISSWELTMKTFLMYDAHVVGRVSGPTHQHLCWEMTFWSDAPFDGDKTGTLCAPILMKAVRQKWKMTSTVHQLSPGKFGVRVYYRDVVQLIYTQYNTLVKTLISGMTKKNLTKWCFPLITFAIVNPGSRTLVFFTFECSKTSSTIALLISSMK